VNPFVLKQQQQVRETKRNVLAARQENKIFVRSVLTQWDKVATAHAPSP